MSSRHACTFPSWRVRPAASFRASDCGSTAAEGFFQAWSAASTLSVTKRQLMAPSAAERLRVNQAKNAEHGTGSRLLTNGNW